MRTALLVLLFAVPLHAAEPTPFRWQQHEKVPQRISDVAVGLNLGLDAWDALVRTDSRTRWGFVCRTALTIGVAESVKRLVHRDRPDGADQRSFFSEHTALASSAAHSPLTASLALSVGWGRQAGGKHFGSDVIVGASVGVVSRVVCPKGER